MTTEMPISIERPSRDPSQIAQDWADKLALLQLPDARQKLAALLKARGKLDDPQPKAGSSF